MPQWRLFSTTAAANTPVKNRSILVTLALVSVLPKLTRILVENQIVGSLLVLLVFLDGLASAWFDFFLHTNMQV